MLKPSYVEMLRVLNPNDDPKSIAGSRYTIIIATAKRARQLVDHAEPMADKPTVNKPVSIAVEELYEGKIHIEEGPEEELTSRLEMPAAEKVSGVFAQEFEEN